MSSLLGTLVVPERARCIIVIVNSVGGTRCRLLVDRVGFAG
jgi:hypothetical protein